MKSVISENVQSITTKEGQKLYLDETDADKIKGKRVCIIDDVISTGESLRAIEKLAVKAGGHVKYRAAILAEGQAAESGRVARPGSVSPPGDYVTAAASSGVTAAPTPLDPQVAASPSQSDSPPGGWCGAMRRGECSA